MDVILYSAGGHSRSVSEIIYKLDLNIIAYAERSKSKWLKNVPLISDDEIITFSNKVRIVIGLGGINPEQLKTRINKIINISKTKSIISLIDPSAIIAKDSTIEEGAIIMPGVTIGENTVIGAGSVVHESIPSNVAAAGNPANILKTLV